MARVQSSIQSVSARTFCTVGFPYSDLWFLLFSEFVVYALFERLQIWRAQMLHDQHNACTYAV